MSEAEQDWDDFESGPFCRHWHDPIDCVVCCFACGLTCRDHQDDECSWTEDSSWRLGD